MRRRLIPPVLLILLVLLVVCRFLYPHTKLAYFQTIELPFQKHLNVQSAHMRCGEQLHLKLNGLYRRARYSSSDFRIASVSFSGTVTALKPGTAIIYVTQGKTTYRCKITVRK